MRYCNTEESFRNFHKRYIYGTVILWYVVYNRTDSAEYVWPLQLNDDTNLGSESRAAPYLCSVKIVQKLDLRHSVVSSL